MKTLAMEKIPEELEAGSAGLSEFFSKVPSHPTIHQPLSSYPIPFKTQTTHQEIKRKIKSKRQHCPAQKQF